MCARSPILILGMMLGLLSAGCNQSRTLTAQVPGTSGPVANGWQQPAAQPFNAQLSDLGRRATALDVDNRDLHAELARSDQQNQLLKSELSLVRERLAETANQLRELQLAKQDAEKQIETFQASVTRGGGAIIKANNSLKNSLHLIQVPGTEVRQDGDVIRIELPADQLFQQGTAQILPSGYNLIDQVANSIQRAYPRQKIGVEGYTDTSAATSSSSHQLTSAQAQAMLEVLSRRNGIPEGQLLAVSHGANHPRASNGTPAGRAKNRRIELVIYPETATPN